MPVRDEVPIGPCLDAVQKISVYKRADVGFSGTPFWTSLESLNSFHERIY